MLLIHSGLDLETGLAQGEFSSVGSYPLFFVTTSGETLHPKCVRELVEGHPNLGDPSQPCPMADEWKLLAHDVNWEDPDLYCDHCGERIQSAYAEPNSC